MTISLKDWLLLIEHYGSVAAAARSQNITRQSLSEKFNKLPDDNPLKIEYQKLAKSKGGRPKKYPDKKTGDRIRQRRYRLRKRKAQ
ncbi:hypothetical protein [Myxosarcina sp. GI1]|uniref:hypothetical protein n=1 Tax=Myxosarcina sp. GI1 TaxID=1541065 RepID=UPI00055FD326|nr:hypothetical protein [Myxosarcina sp. GI1]